MAKTKTATKKIEQVLDNSEIVVKPKKKYNIENIEPYFFNKLSKEQRSEIARKGAEATNRIRKEKKTLKQTLEVLLDMKDIKSNLTMQEKICIALTNEAGNGNTRAFEVLRDTIGQKPTDKQEITTTINYERVIKEIAGDEF